MMSQTLRDARKYEEIAERGIAPLMRPEYHLTPRTGWMNDPNGFTRYGGLYHMFYQYYPYASHWDSMHWGHAVSRDLLTWEYLPAALAPDESYDGNGCFSGSAVTLPDGRQLLMYTGVRLHTDENGIRREVQTQNIAVGDGTDFEKFAQNPVLDETAVPEGGSRYDFRDPKIIELSDGSLAALVGNRPADGSGQILLYRSRDGFRWDYWRKLAENRGRFGRMWECPDFFELDGKWLLLVSPQDMMPEGFKYHNGNGTVCIPGTFDEASGEFTEDTGLDQPVDYGIDFYAPQTVLTEDGRRVMIGWMQNWDACAIREPEAPWAGQMSIPRELHFRDGKLCQQPIRELTEKRRNGVAYEGVRVGGADAAAAGSATAAGRVTTDADGAVRLAGVSGRVIDMEVEIAPAPGKELFRRMAIEFAQNQACHTTVSFRPHEHTLKIDRKFSGSRRAIIHQRRALVEDQEGALRLRILLDRYSAEIFVGSGEQVLSAAIYTDLEADGIRFLADGEAVINVKKWDLI